MHEELSMDALKLLKERGADVDSDENETGGDHSQRNGGKVCDVDDENPQPPSRKRATGLVESGKPKMAEGAGKYEARAESHSFYCR